MKATALQTPRSVSVEGGAGGALGTRAQIPLCPGMQTMVRQLCPTAHGGPLWIRYPPAAHGGLHAGAWGSLKEAVTRWEASALSRGRDSTLEQGNEYEESSP